jgi:DNA-directed RNA polymerase specialized sigma24 family protein
MARRPDATDVLIYNWARTRRQLLGLSNPSSQREFVGGMRCTLGGIKSFRDGAGAFTARKQHFPEVYVGDSLWVNLAVKRMTPEMRNFIDLHYTLGRGANRRAELLGIPRDAYWRRVRDAKHFVEGFLAGRQEPQT